VQIRAAPIPARAALLAAIVLMGNLQASEQNRQLNMTPWQIMDALQLYSDLIHFTPDAN